MPFVMAHLYIAYNILGSVPQIEKPCDFLLGALAPDSVHFHDNFESSMKKASHLCVGDERWGRITNNEEWLGNVFALLQENKYTEKADFIYGYCSHILADIQNNIKVWTPFRMANETALANGAGSIYHQEAAAVDYALYLMHPEQVSIWHMLKNAAAYGIPNIACADMIEKMKDSVLYSQFNDREIDDLSLNKYVTVSDMQEFISAESQYIKEVLYPKGVV